ncbi:tyrosine-protein kinase [Elysia marginata]|uniref:Tyrosine-protein kinase n=1 Tax=Elysia marginata TaxID=1093978 RepID=A0AAV4FTB6_9GAST|nr:tyrosine-protein kinase [Elysia marginata]
MEFNKPIADFVDKDLSTTVHDLNLCKVLGSGMCGDVFLFKDPVHGDAALKTFSSATCASFSSSSCSSSTFYKTLEKMFRKEVSIMRRCHHPNLMRVLYSSRMQDCLAIVMPLMEQGSLGSALRSSSIPSFFI